MVPTVPTVPTVPKASLESLIIIIKYNYIYIINFYIKGKINKNKKLTIIII